MINKGEKSDPEHIEGRKESFPTISSGGSGEQSADGTIEQLGSQIGPYKLLSVLGEGGFGIVYLAEQKEPVRRQVALKVIKPGMDSRQVISRFETERQALALLDHSNIAHVFDAGTTDSGRPYFVMEYVKGMPITEYCDQEKLSIEERLQLFIHVCEAVQHAHQKGIIHRDIKPSNILVSAQDDKPIPKIIDFGVAKAVSQPLTERTLFTEQGQLLGTPEYMSPEQAHLTSQDIDTRSDVYSLGVLLYELLTGTLPFDQKTLREAAFDEILRIIREEDPPRPSTRLSGLEEEGKKVAENRRTQLITLAKRLQKELEWIPLKAMRKERTHRYQSASELAADIRNYLEGNPLIAGPESVAYRLKKYVRQHRALVTGIAAVLVVLIGGIVISTIFAVVAEREKLRTMEESEARRRELYFNRIYRVEREIEEGNFDEAQTILKQCHPDLRSWEWNWLKYLSERNIKTFTGLDSYPRSVVYSPNGNRIASSGSGNTVRIWDIKNGQNLLVLQGLPDHATSVCFSPDGRKIAAACRGVIRIWNSRDGSELLTLKQESSYVGSEVVVFSPDGKHIAANLGNGTTIWDISREHEIVTLGDKGHRSCVRFSPYGKRIAFPSGRGNFSIWDIETGQEVIKFSSHSDTVTSISFSSDGELVASGSRDNTIKIWDANTGQLLNTLIGHEGPVMSVAFSPDGKKLASVAGDNTIFLGDRPPGVLSSDRSIRIWDVQTGRTDMILKGHHGAIRSVAYSPSGNQLATVSNDRTIKIWDIRPRPKILVPPDGPCSLPEALSRNDAIIFLSYAADDQCIIAADPEKIFILEENNGNIHSRQIDIHIRVDRDLIFPKWSPVVVSEDNKQFAVVTKEGEARIWDLDSLHEVGAIELPKTENIAIGFVNGSSSLVYLTDTTAVVYDVNTQREISVLNAPPSYRFSGYITQLGKDKLILGTQANSYTNDTFSDLMVFDINREEKIATLWRINEGEEGYLLSTSSDNKWIAAASGSISEWEDDRDRGMVESKLKFWEKNTIQDAMEERKGTVVGGRILTFSPDTNRIVLTNISFLFDATLKLLDREIGRKILGLKAHRSAVTAAAFSSDGRTLVTGGADGEIILWGEDLTE